MSVSRDRDPFFLIYKSRSGSTYLSDLLDRHPAISVALESNLVPRLLHWQKSRGDAPVESGNVDAVLDVLYDEPKFATWRIDRVALATTLRDQAPFEIAWLIRYLVQQTCTLGRDGVVAFGMKKNGWFARRIVQLQKLFPGAKFIHIVRDGRAVYASAREAIHSERGKAFEDSAVASALQWVRIVEAVDHAARYANVHQVCYEELLREPERVLGALLAFLEVEANDQLLATMLQQRKDPKRDVPESQRHLHENVGKAPRQDRIEAWRTTLSTRDISRYELVAGDVLARKGYSLVNPSRRLGRVVSSMARLEATARSWRQTT